MILLLGRFTIAIRQVPQPAPGPCRVDAVRSLPLRDASTETSRMAAAVGRVAFVNPALFFLPSHRAPWVLRASLRTDLSLTPSHRALWVSRALLRTDLPLTPSSRASFAKRSPPDSVIASLFCVAISHCLRHRELLLRGDLSLTPSSRASFAKRPLTFH